MLTTGLPGKSPFLLFQATRFVVLCNGIPGKLNTVGEQSGKTMSIDLLKYLEKWQDSF